MKTLTVIKGVRGSGKTTKAKEIIGRSEFIFVSDHDITSAWAFSELKETTQFILIDDITVSNFKRISEKFYRGRITVNKPGELTKVFECPSIVCVLRNE